MVKQDDIDEKDVLESPEEKGEDSVSGSESTPDSDDSVDKMTKEVGLYDEGDSDKAQEVSIADQIDGDSLKNVPPDK